MAVVHPAHATRIGLASMVNDVPGHRATVVVPDGNGLLHALRKGTHVDLALVSLPPPTAHVPNLLALLHHRYADVGTVALCHTADDEATGHAMGDHARTVLLDDVLPTELGTALVNVMEHRFHRSAPVDRLLCGEQPPRPVARHARLSPREREALQWWCNPLQLTKAQVAKRVDASVDTVKSLLHRAYKKLGFPHRAAAMRWWAQHRKDWN